MKQAVNGVREWLTELVAYVTKLANGDMTASMPKASGQDQIHEWLVLLKSNINALATDVNALAKAGLEGDLEARADAVRHPGEFRKIVEGINACLEAIAVPVAPRMTSLFPKTTKLTNRDRRVARS